MYAIIEACGRQYKVKEGEVLGTIYYNKKLDGMDKLFINSFKIEKKKISLKLEIKAFGSYEADIRLYKGINAKITAQVLEA